MSGSDSTIHSIEPSDEMDRFHLLFVAFAIKLPIFPFHTWMLKVHTEAPPSIVMIHSGILLKMGAYGLIRFGILFFPGEAKEWAWIGAARLNQYYVWCDSRLCAKGL